MHITFFSFREYIQCIDSEQWTDLSFLKISSPDPKGKNRFGIFKSRFSLVLCGSDDQHWVGWAFSDRDLEANELEEDEFQYHTAMPHEDPIASDNGEQIVDANTPIRDARAYFLIIFDIRIAAVLLEWQVLIRAVERGVEGYVC